MNNLGTVKPPGNTGKKNQQSANPFARALAESEKRSYSQDNSQPKQDPFSEALSRVGGQIPAQSDKDQAAELRAQQEQLAKERKKMEMRKKLHDQVNPVDQQDIFNANKERTKKELNQVRQELKKLSAEITKFYKEVDIAVTQDIVDQGIDGGIGIQAYFDKLKAFIILLTQKVKSARTWMKQQQAKAKKSKSRKVKGGMMIGGGKAESKAVFDMMHHERSNAYSGG
jgi:type II secretory pathway pseudopilin PulG